MPGENRHLFLSHHDHGNACALSVSALSRGCTRKPQHKLIGLGNAEYNELYVPFAKGICAVHFSFLISRGPLPKPSELCLRATLPRQSFRRPCLGMRRKKHSGVLLWAESKRYLCSRQTTKTKFLKKTRSHTINLHRSPCWLLVLLVCSLHFANLRIGLFGCEVLVLLLLLPCAWLAGFCVFQ